MLHAQFTMPSMPEPEFDAGAAPPPKSKPAHKDDGCSAQRAHGGRAGGAALCTCALLLIAAWRRARAT